MSGAEFLGPVIGLAMKLLLEFSLNSVSFKIEAHGMDMVARNVKDDIEDARMFYDQLTKYVNQELQLKRRVLISINNTEYALKMFEEYLKEHNSRQTLSKLLGDRAKVKKLLAPLQASQSQLARRIDWMRSALSDLEKSPNASKEKRVVDWSVPPNERPGWVGTKGDTKE
ncbi:uncharacterized protein NECHADRAFT_85917 [Fusarium vanettenii 77-13-4]|uniref:Uncharacterized protein n=1 Tax=Fusarium vanettenii (strain ATCC MYA-4622 / CBS 123669 / FGSC 9596 / NRRL 45880 / 77-13-4) TaxID=660122 RepID=C7Z1U4_FUSV7|nr:uncharacterized protein NECHADRAFT_85917 [Fusarium vanettenii 77-13-4]EEU41884.1 predicted protein [Fusarium vanettenii 77-13-4]